MKTSVLSLGQTPESIVADIAIVGSGPAGLSLAHALRTSGKRVVLVETGNDDPADEATRSLSVGTNEHAFSPAPSEGNRIRQLGGNANAWNLWRPNGEAGVRMVELDDVDFEARPATGNVGWPFAKAALQPWYDKASQLLEMVPFSQLSTTDGLQTDLITTRYAQVAPVRMFLERMKGETVAADNITVLTGATLVKINLDNGPNPRVSSIVVGSLSGVRCTISASEVVLAGGGFENPRQLLLAERVRGTGLAETGPLGKFLMEHPMDSSDFVRAAPADRDRAVFPPVLDMSDQHESVRIAYLSVRPEIVASQDLLGMSTWVFPRPRKWEPAEGANALRFLAGRGVPPPSPPGRTGAAAKVEAMRRLATAPGTVAYWLSKGKLGDRTSGNLINRSGWAASGTGQNNFAFHNLTRIIEQGPSAQNRVQLSGVSDGFGLPQAHIVWKWTDADVSSTLRAKSIVDGEIERLGLGEVLNRSLEHAVPGAAHILGATRMHPDPDKGVVDANCQVHGIQNLYVNGSSVFPTGGWANPTYTIVALSLRLAAHLSREV